MKLPSYFWIYRILYYLIMKHSTTIVNQKKTDINRKSKRVLEKGKSSTEELPTFDNAEGDSLTGWPIKRARSELQIGDQSGGAKLNDGPAAEVKETDKLVKKVVYGNRWLSAKISEGTPQKVLISRNRLFSRLQGHEPPLKTVEVGSNWI